MSVKRPCVNNSNICSIFQLLCHHPIGQNIFNSLCLFSFIFQCSISVNIAGLYEDFSEEAGISNAEELNESNLQKMNKVKKFISAANCNTS